MKEVWFTKDGENIINYVINKFGFDLTDLIELVNIELIETHQQ